MVVLALHRDTLTHRQFTENEKVIAILWYLVVAMIGIWGSIDLAKAKGHGSEIVAFILVTGFCLCPIFYLLMPFIILFALDDREPRHGRHRH